MIGSSHARTEAEDHDPLEPPAFLASHRALAVCTRELSRLNEEIERAVAAFPLAATETKATVEHSPGRLIVQHGPVALTVAWLRGTLDSVSQGELLVIVWRGVVAPRRVQRPERIGAAPLAAGATPLWERVLVAEADNEAAWAWRSQDGSEAGLSSAELALRCVERLQKAHAAC